MYKIMKISFPQNTQYSLSSATFHTFNLSLFEALFSSSKLKLFSANEFRQWDYQGYSFPTYSVQSLVSGYKLLIKVFLLPYEINCFQYWICTKIEYQIIIETCFYFLKVKSMHNVYMMHDAQFCKIARP